MSTKPSLVFSSAHQWYGNATRWIASGKCDAVIMTFTGSRYFHLVIRTDLAKTLIGKSLWEHLPDQTAVPGYDLFVMDETKDVMPQNELAKAFTLTKVITL